ETHSFSLLYLANVLGALLGTFLTTFAFVELFGFQRTLMIAVVSNTLIFVASLFVNKRIPVAIEAVKDEPVAATTAQEENPIEEKWGVTLLFVTGLCSLAMEVVWTRAFTPLVGNTTYAFASLLLAYLAATVLGSRQYRSDVFNKKVQTVPVLLAALILTSIAPLVLNDPRIAYVVLAGLLAIKQPLESAGLTPLN